MSKFQLDNDVPLPKSGGRAPKTQYPFAEMEIGQSFFAPDTNVKKMSGQVSYWKKDPHNMAFSLRAVTEEYMDDNGDLVEGEGVRVWKIDPANRRGGATSTKPKPETAPATTKAKPETAPATTKAKPAADKAPASKPAGKPSAPLGKNGKPLTGAAAAAAAKKTKPVEESEY